MLATLTEHLERVQAAMINFLSVSIMVGAYPIIAWINIRRLKRLGVKWSSNKGLAFFMAGPRWGTYSLELRSGLKGRMASYNEVISDNELDLFIGAQKRTLGQTVLVVLFSVILLTEIVPYFL
jgi:hypothetical protein